MDLFIRPVSSSAISSPFKDQNMVIFGENLPWFLGDSFDARIFRKYSKSDGSSGMDALLLNFKMRIKIEL